MCVWHGRIIVCTSLHLTLTRLCEVHHIYDADYAKAEKCEMCMRVKTADTHMGHVDRQIQMSDMFTCKATAVFMRICAHVRICMRTTSER